MDQGITGATIFKQSGMVKELAKRSNDYPIFASYRFLLDLDHQEARRILWC
jgi:hypothetical protein